MIESESEGSSYQLSKKNFLDIIYNRFGLIEFRRTGLYRGCVYNLPVDKDRFGRTKLWLVIDTEYPSQEQQQTLVHEVIHVDRNPWARIKRPPFFSDEPDWEGIAEEILTDEAATAFYEANRPLVRKALHHVWVRRAVRRSQPK